MRSRTRTKKSRAPKKRRTFLSPGTVRRLWILPFVIPVFLGVLAWSLLTPHVISSSFQLNGVPRKDLSMPFVYVKNGKFDIEFSFNLAVIHPRYFYVIGDDCINTLQINGKRFPDRPVHCGIMQGKTIDLGEMVQSGKNIAKANLTNEGGAFLFYLRPSLADPMVAGFFVIVILAMWWACLVAARIRGKKLNDAALVLIVIAMLALRVAYVMQTPYFARNHDNDGHVEYIQYIVTHLAIPPSNTGWEFWQPSLYYLASSVWYDVGVKAEMTMAQSLSLVQMQSLALGLMTVVLSFIVARFAFAEKESRRMFVLAMGTLPGLVFLTSRINNDVLAYALSFLGFVLLLTWWKKGTWKWWYAAIAVISLAVLSKYNGLLVAPVAGFTLLLKTNIHWKNRLLHLSAAILMVTLALALSLSRTEATTAKVELVGNIDSLGNDLRLPNDFLSLTTFNPVQIVRHPYNNPWGDVERRANFFEYFFRSAFAGEWNFGDDHKLPLQWILILAMLLLPVAGLGLAFSISQWRSRAPFLCAFFVLILGHAAFRLVSPFSPSQDFRYSPLLAVPVFFFLCEGLTLLPPAFRRFGASLFYASILLWVLFVFSL